MTTIDEKITAIINHFQLNNYAFSKRIGVTGTTVDSIVNGRPQADGSRKKTKPGYDVLAAIIDEFDINPDYLFGKSTVLLKSNIVNTPTYSGMPKVVTTTPDGEENVVFVPVKARAGYLDGYGDAEFIETLPAFYMPQLTNGTFRCFEVQGNSMVGTFFNGDMVFGRYIEAFNDIKDGRVYIIISKNDGVVLKRVINRIEDQGKLILKSDNKDGNYPTFTINSEDIMEVWDVAMYASKQMPEPVDVSDRLHDLESKLLELQQKVSQNSKN
ncbi:S24 family peptidase [Psychroserpens damuponensis]|uniref:S24 family peptidase n=1 Tax=Psychroserpens damuponensis TaxID=943936 RepID=UPI00058DCEFA|nr:S24 family peptidase [Psychroserpens damuponensis]